LEVSCPKFNLCFNKFIAKAFVWTWTLQVRNGPWWSWMYVWDYMAELWLLVDN
jgi:hypothetical protein